MSEVMSGDLSPTPPEPPQPPGPPRVRPPDQGARDRIISDLASTLFVEAGAGAGKTTSLVGRVLALVDSGVPVGGIAAITFTEKAAAELRDRLRRELELLVPPTRGSADPERPGTSAPPSAPSAEPEVAERRRRALAELDHAPIGTLHAFARRLLDEFPIDAGLPPGFSVLDELESDLRFEEEWEALLDDLLAEVEPAGGIIAGGRDFVDLCDVDGFGVDTGVKQVALGFRYNWDLVEALVDRHDPPPLELRTGGLADEARAIGATPVPDDDRQAGVVADFADAGEELAAADTLGLRLRALSRLSGLSTSVRLGNKRNWAQLGPDRLADLREREQRVADAAARHVEAAVAHRKRLLGALCGRFVLDAARARVEAGHVDFHDLLVHARRLLATEPSVRRVLHDRYPRLLLDEFQDTDPIQLEIAVRLSAPPDDPHQESDWRRLRPLPGRLFVVGDPKQSIYRFRRADISQYLAAADQVGADTERLTANFRSSRAVIEFTNDVFERVIVEEPDAQPAFQRLDAARRPDHLEHGSVVVLGAEPHLDLAERSWDGDGSAADELRRREAVDVAGAITTALTDGWPVVDATTEELRPCRPGDICVLVPTRLSLAALDAELDVARIPARAENSSIVYAASEIRDLLLTLRAADDPTDELAVVAALRSPLYGCSDVELFEWRTAGGSWSLFAPPPDGFDEHRVAAGIAHLRSVHRRATASGAAELLAAVAEERRVFDAALGGHDHRDVWRRLRFVIDQARAWADAGGRGLRRYLAWAALQASEGRVSETILPEHDHDAVRIMTVHGAKGLEFPITIVSGLTTEPRRRRGTEVVFAADAWHLTGRGDDGSFAEARPIDELMGDAERRRLLYVAATRAVDHLVVSLHRRTPDDKLATKEPGSCTSAELLVRSGAAEPTSGARPARYVPSPLTPPTGDRSAASSPDVDAWRDEYGRIREAAVRRSAIAATRLADEVRLLAEREASDDPGLDKQPVNIDLPPWQRGRYGTSIGRAVHGVLQFCDLATGDDVDALARSQCAAEGILGLHDRVADLARSALGAPIVRAVVDGADHWRELFIAAPVGGRVLEGYIDLLVRTPTGLVIADYKTDQWSGPAQTAERVGRYRVQLAAYGAALEALLDEPVVGGVLVRCRAGEAAEQIEVPDWSEALDEVRRLVT